MTQVETVPVIKTFVLTSEQQNGVTKIQHELGKDLKANTTAAVKTACELMENLGIPKQEICHLICQRAEEWDYSEDHLRRFVPVEYKNKAQREVRLTHAHTHEGRHNDDQHETKTIQVNNGQDIKFETKDPMMMKKGHLTASEMIQKYKDQARLAERKLTEYRVDNDYTPIFKYIREQRSDAELAEKVRNFMEENKTYKEWLKQEDEFEASVTVEGKTKEQAYIDNNMNNEISVAIKSKSKKSKRIK
jgi:nucleotide-binding universal stress UspA family protein